MIARRRSLVVLTWIALAALALSWSPTAGASISPQPLAEITIAAHGGHPTNSAAGQVRPDSVTIEVPIAAASDDAGVNAAWDWCFYGANHNEIYFGQCADGADIMSGFRFNPVAIPRGAHIVEAHIRFTVDGPYTGAMTVRFRGEASGNAAPFGDDSRPDNRPLIPNAMADWQITPSDPWTLGETRNSPPLTAIVQAIVDRSDWSSGNALAIITQNVGTATGNWRHRRVIGYERPVWYPGTEYAARLVVTYGEQPPPPSPAPDWSTMGGQEEAQMGRAAAGAGDVNGDGYDDLLVSAEWYDNGEFDEGRVYAFYGSAAGLSPTPNWTAESDSAGAFFGYSASTAGDVNGDGFADVIVGARGYSNGQAVEGRVYLYLGSPSGLGVTAAWTWESDQSGAKLGDAVSTAGDVNGDGYSDVLVTAPFYDSGQVDEGKAFVFYGSPAGLGSTPNWTAESDQDGAQFGGNSGTTAGDVNGDGYADVIVGALYYDNGQTDEGRAFVFLGSASGLASTASWTAESDQDGAAFGVSASTAGDVNGDGYADVVVGSYYYSHGAPNEGAAFVYLGSAAGLGSTYTWMAEGDQPSAAFGMYSTTAGDINGDGYADLFVTAPWYSGDQYREGRAYVYNGSVSGLQSTPAWTAEGNQDSSLFGYSGPGHAGDVNGDGYADIVIGALWYDGGQTDEGAAFVYHGGPDGLSTTANWTAEGNQEGARSGCWVSTAGDVNGDGFDDILAGAPNYDNGEADEGRAFLYYGSEAGLENTPAWTAESNQVGAALGPVSAAGDVNGDGYGDVIVGVPGYDGSQTDEGRAFVYYGSATGLSMSANWTGEGTQPAAYFGQSVSAAGDVNGDGYSDVIVGAYLYDHGEVDEGAAFLYYGSPDGLESTPAWMGESNQSGALFGDAISTAGDVNGDGYSDVIVGAKSFRDTLERQGKAYLFYGSSAGLSPTPGWTALGETWVAAFGMAVGNAGDVNGDGYSDIVVGSPGFDGGMGWAQGAIYAYHGSATGLPTSADRIIMGDQSNSYFGVAAKTAGDVNGDGYADLVVGTHRYSHGQVEEGRASLYLGSRTGLNNSVAWLVEGDQTQAYFGFGVGSAGDVNSDSYADLIVGAASFDAGQTDEGAAFVYYGNHGGLSLRPQQRRSDNSAPIATLGKSDQPDRFRLALLGRTPFGRGKVKLEWEVKPRGVLFDGTGMQRSAAWVDTGTAGALLDELVDDLQQDTLYHWRVRLLYHPATTPFQQYSRWLTNPWNGWNEARLRTAGPPTAVKLATLEATPGTPSYLPGGGVVALIGLFLGAVLFLARRRCSVILRHQCSDTSDIVAPKQSHMRASPPGGGPPVLVRTSRSPARGLSCGHRTGKRAGGKEECLLQENSSQALLSRSTVMLTTS